MRRAAEVAMATAAERVVAPVTAAIALSFQLLAAAPTLRSIFPVPAYGSNLGIFSVTSSNLVWRRVHCTVTVPDALAASQACLYLMPA